MAFKHEKRIWLVQAAVFCAAILCGYLLRHLNLVFNPVVWTSTQIISAVLGFTIAANVLPRFLGSGDRPALILGTGVGLVGWIQLAGIAEFYFHFSNFAPHPATSLSSLSWMIGQTLLALLLFATPPLERWLSWPRQRKKVILAALSLVASACGVIAAVFLLFPHEEPIWPNGLLSRPWNLLPAGIFFAATVVLNRETSRRRSAFDACLVWVATMNAACHLMALESARVLDAPDIAAQVLRTGSYAVLLACTLLDNVRLFGQVRDRAMSDSLTGLANYRQFVDNLQHEIERTGRFGRPFSVLLMDLDGLKAINDQYGHLTGSRAICRVAEILLLHCRVIDTAARYGGDEFVLLLPETDEGGARHVAALIQKRLESDAEFPRLSLSMGVSTHPQNGTTVQHLLGAADRELYAAKALSRKRGAKGTKTPRILS